MLVISPRGSRTGVTRKFIGATLEGQTRDADGLVFAEVELEGLTHDVRARARSQARDIAQIAPSSGTCGLSRERSRTSEAAARRSKSSFDPPSRSVSARPKRDRGSFNVMIAGQAFDTVHLLDSEKFVEFFYDLTGRRDVVFKDIHTVTYWK